MPRNSMINENSTVKPNKLKAELMSLIDEDNQVELEKVDRYMNLVDIFYQLDESIAESGVMVITENGSQRFMKENPAIAAKVKVNASLIKLDSFFDKKREEKLAKDAKSNVISEDDFI